MAKFKVGDKVVIARKGDSNWNQRMDKYIGKVMTIREINTPNYYSMEGNPWEWEKEWLDPYIEEITITRHGNKAVAKMGKKVGVAKCSPDDEFDLYTGSKLALDRLFGKEVKEEKPKEEGIKEGDIVKIIDSGMLYTTGVEWVVKNIEDKEMIARYRFDCSDGVHDRITDKWSPLKGEFRVVKLLDGKAFVTNTANRYAYLVGIYGLEKV